MILIDEYDTPLISAYKYQYYNEAKNFFSSLYGKILKDNKIFQLRNNRNSKSCTAGILSELNNMSEHSILDKECDEYFGF